MRSAKRYPPPATRELEENWGKFPFPKSEKVENMVRKKKLDQLSEPPHSTEAELACDPIVGEGGWTW